MPPAIGDAYATAAEYRSRVTKSSTSDDTLIDALLATVSRSLIDRPCERHFTKDAAPVVRLYHGNGRRELNVDDIATLTGLVVKVDLNRDYAYSGSDETLAINTHFWLNPPNADKEAEPEPWTQLELVLYNPVLSIWPPWRRSVQVTACFGWPAVPGAIKEATVMIARELRDLEEAGMTLDLQNMDQVQALAPAAFSIVERIKGVYGKGKMVR